MPADAIGQHEQPAMSARPFRGVGDDMTEIILVLLSDLSAVGKLRKFDIQHRRLRRYCRGAGINCPLKVIPHLFSHSHGENRAGGWPPNAPARISAVARAVD